MALLADTINDGKGPQPTLEKIRCLKAIREMIRIARSHVGNGLPQVMVCGISKLNQADAKLDLCLCTFGHRKQRPYERRLQSLGGHDELTFRG